MNTIKYNTVKDFKKALKLNKDSIVNIFIRSSDCCEFATINFLIKDDNENYQTHNLDININVNICRFLGSGAINTSFFCWNNIVIGGNIKESVFYGVIDLINDTNIKDTLFRIYVRNNNHIYDNLNLVCHELFLSFNHKKTYLLQQYVGLEDVNSPFYKR